MSNKSQQELNPNQARTGDISQKQMVELLKKAELEGNDVFYSVLGDMVKARGVSHVASSAGLDRTNLYRSLRSGSHPRYETVKKVLQSLGISTKLV